MRLTQRGARFNARAAAVGVAALRGWHPLAGLLRGNRTRRIRRRVPHKRQIVGADGERAAERFLRRHHYAILHRNYRCRYGELDLVALDGPVVVFVEVKTRSHDSFGTPTDAIDRRKQRQIERTALHYLLEHRLMDRPARFDVVGVWWDGPHLRCELVRNAFEARG